MNLEKDKETGKMLKEARKSKGLTLADVADQVGVSISAISRIENGNRVDFGFKLGRMLENLYGIKLNGTQSKRDTNRNDTDNWATAMENIEKLQMFFENEKMIFEADLLFALQRSIHEKNS